jgi:hypothetical protein
MTKEKQIELLEKQLAFWKHHCTELLKKLTKEEEISNRYAEMLDKTEEELNTERVKTEWISVEERLPKADTDVLVITANGSFKVGRCNIYHNGTLVLWMTNDGLGEKAITHWMPLPEAPKMRKEDEGK